MATALPGCVSSLRSSLASLDGSISTLEAGVGDFPRLARVLQTTRHYELLPESTLQSAQSALLATIGPELQTLLSRVETHLERMARREQALVAKAELLAGRLGQETEHSSARSRGGPGMRGEEGEEGEHEEKAQKMKQLRQKKERLSFAVDRLAMQAQQKERRLRVSMAAQ